MPTWVAATVGGGFGLLYTYGVWNALAFLISQATGPLGLNGSGWFLLILAVVFPILVFAGAFWLGYRFGVRRLALILLAGLGVTAVFWLNVIAYASVYGASLLGTA
jgi:hypothetical protein